MPNCRLWLLATLILPAPTRADAVGDRQTEHRIVAVLDQQHALRGEVQARASDGIVTLTGRVQDRDQRALAAETVGAVPGVLAVDNRLELATPEPERADGWIALKVRSALLLGRGVRASTTNVAVQDGVVTLTGTADSERQSRLTAALARDIEGVRSVRNELLVRRDEGPGAPVPATPPPADEAALSAAVTAALRSAPALAGKRISVEADGAVVTLRGRVASDAERELAARLAAGVPAVHSVVNHLAVEAAE
jgi:osmotically-inducible protein OsmY